MYIKGKKAHNLVNSSIEQYKSFTSRKTPCVQLQKQLFEIQQAQFVLVVTAQLSTYLFYKRFVVASKAGGSVLTTATLVEQGMHNVRIAKRKVIVVMMSCSLILLLWIVFFICLSYNGLSTLLLL